MALWEALADSGGVWFAWSGETVEDEPRGLRVYSEDGVDHALIDLTEEEHDGYYMGFANRALWPILHYRIDLAVFDEHEFQLYESVNRRFARLIAPRLRADDTVWVHDYHFFLLGEALRSEGWSGPIGFFLHVPFPAPEVFRALPEHARIARALSQFDLVGFQTQKDALNFERYLREEHDAVDGPDGALEVFRDRVRAEAFPIGIDADEIA
ncbi:MAG: trehalose-6-phosphate synthase, partial [Caulobacterales bacterium]|nr:trehalose-6-phosphate synthase [Caulobacterales bacterium]